MKKHISILALVFTITFASAQNKPSNYLNKRWKHVARNMPAEWYASDQAKLVADNVMLAQKDIGGWEKNKPYHQLSESEKEQYIQGKSKKGGTFDNGSTITELRFLAKVYSNIQDARYKEAFEKGVNYILSAQYDNGGWPQYFPVKDPEDEIRLDKTEPYSMHITYNDNAMVNTMRFLKDIFSNEKAFKALKLSKAIKDKAEKAFNKGVECILDTQIIVDGKRTVWCAQHDAKTLAPANARSYELASFSGSESVDILLLLMDIEKPSKEVAASICEAITWFENHKIEGVKIKTVIDENGKKDRVVVEDKKASPLWGRFYDLETEKIYFCDRDGIKKNTLAEIGHERRIGYGWYTDSPEKAIKKYKEEWLWKRICSSDIANYLIHN